MRLELFGTDWFGDVEYLGSFIEYKHMFQAMDEWLAMGYKNIKYATWKAAK